MDAPSLTPERSRELADLRRRAYGPDADIQRDPDAVLRLHELEEFARLDVEAAAETTLESPPSQETPEQPARPAPPQDSSVGAAASASATPEDGTQPERAPARPWWRAAPVWGIAAGCLVIGASLGAWGYSLTLAKPDFTLEIASQAGARDEDWQTVLSVWGFDPGSAVPYESFNGLDLWMARSDTGARCVLVSHEAEPLSASCATGDLEPNLDFMVLPGRTHVFDEPLDVGTVIRFVGHSGGIDVWVRSPSGVAEGQSANTSWRDSAPSLP
ncbi:MAG: hypothetical protein ABWY55_10890 [Microbacterium sp.]